MKLVRIVKICIAVLMTAAVLFVGYLFIVRVMLAGQLEEVIALETKHGEHYCYNLMDMKNAKKCFNKVLFLDKCIVFWNDNTGLPGCYANLAYVYSGMENYNKSAEMYEKALSAYEEFLPESHDNIALMHTNASVIYAMCGDNDMVMQHAGAAYEYYCSLPAEHQNGNAGTAAMELAGAYYNIHDYETAVEYFEIALPILYKNTEWSIENDEDPQLLATLYKMAASAYKKLGDDESCRLYEEKCSDMMWIRSISEEDINQVMEIAHWEME